LNRPLRRGLGYPAWRAARAQWEWVELTGAVFSDTVPSPQPLGSLDGRLRAWNGFAVKGTKIITAGIGGHDDWAGNEAMQIELGVDSPTAPTLLKTSSLEADYIQNANYYADGRPTSSHTYRALHYDATRNKVFRMGVGSAYGNGTYQTGSVDAFDLTTNEWDTANTWTDVPALPVGTYPQVQHPTTGDIYIFTVSGLYRWNVSDASYDLLATLPSGADQVQGAAIVIDLARDRLVMFGNRYNEGVAVVLFDLTAETFSVDAMTGTYATRIAAQAGSTAHHNTAIDKYIVRCSDTSTPGNKVTGGEILTVDPDTWATDAQATTGGSGIPACAQENGPGVYGRFGYMPALNGYAYMPIPSGGVWFLAAPAA